MDHERRLSFGADPEQYGGVLTIGHTTEVLVAVHVADTSAPGVVGALRRFGGSAR